MQHPTTSDSNATATDRVVHVAGEIMDDAGERIRSEAGEFLNLAKDRGKSIINEQLAGVATEVSPVAEVIQHAADELYQKDSRFASHYAARAAIGLSDFSDVLRENDVDGLVRSAERCAARSPGVFLGVSVAAGFLLGRFLLSSAQRAMTTSGSPSRAKGGATAYAASGSGAPVISQTSGTH